MNNRTTASATYHRIVMDTALLYSPPAQQKFWRAMELGSKPRVAQSRFRYWTWLTLNAAREYKPLPPFWK